MGSTIFTISSRTRC